MQTPTRYACAAVGTDEGLRDALRGLGAPSVVARAGDPVWEAIGVEVLRRARRDAVGWPRHAGEYVGAYGAACIELLVGRPEIVVRAMSPWGLLVTHARRAAKGAVAAEICQGLGARDAVTHRTRFADVPRVVSLDALGVEPVVGSAW